MASERQNKKEGRAEQSHPGDRQPRRFALFGGLVVGVWYLVGSGHGKLLISVPIVLKRPSEMDL